MLLICLRSTQNLYTIVPSDFFFLASMTGERQELLLGLINSFLSMFATCSFMLSRATDGIGYWRCCIGAAFPVGILCSTNFVLPISFGFYWNTSTFFSNSFRSNTRCSLDNDFPFCSCLSLCFISWLIMSDVVNSCWPSSTTLSIHHLTLQ